MTKYPDFDSVPAVEGQPQGNAWALWGREDELGTLNLLTSDVIVAAAKEVQAGKSIQLDLRLDHFGHGIAGRQRFKQTIIDFKERNKGTEYEFVAHDDVIAFNTQSSSQWDGFRHVGLQREQVYYNGVTHRHIDEQGDGKLGIHKWAENGGIVGRGVLLDYCRWRQQTGREAAKVDSSFGITVDELDQVAKHQNLELKTGDILIIRSGFMAWHDSVDPQERQKALDGGVFIGLESSMKSAKWLWNHHFAAVAGDTLGFEVSPPPLGVEGSTPLHEWLLAHWGCPIGELWDLETLSEECERFGRWSFFFTSAPLNVFGGVGTTPNAIAVL